MPNDALRADLGSFLTAHDAELIDFRRDMHAHPEHQGSVVGCPATP